MAAIDPIEISTLPQFLKEIQDLPRTTHLFRGQGQDYSLKPKIARLKPLTGHTPEMMESQMLIDLKRRAGSWLKDTLIRPDNDWDWLALAQHHGMATRLLDWSDNPLTALFFAVEKAFVAKNAPGAKCPVIWVFRVTDDVIVNLREKNESPFTSEQTYVFRPNHVTPRIVAQNGWFTVHPLRTQRGTLQGFEENPDYEKFLTKFTIQPERVGELRRMLRTCGVHIGSIYPSLEGLCADITERFTHHEDERALFNTIEDNTDSVTTMSGDIS